MDCVLDNNSVGLKEKELIKIQKTRTVKSFLKSTSIFSTEEKREFLNVFLNPRNFDNTILFKAMDYFSCKYLESGKDKWLEMRKVVLDYTVDINKGLVFYLTQNIDRKNIENGNFWDYDSIHSNCFWTMMVCIEKFNPWRGIKFSTYYCRFLSSAVRKVKQEFKHRSRFKYDTILSIEQLNHPSSKEKVVNKNTEEVRPSSRIEKVDLSREVEKCLLQLKEESEIAYQYIICLFFKNETYRSTARIHSCSDTKVHNYVNRAMIFLKEKLEKFNK